MIAAVVAVRAAGWSSPRLPAQEPGAPGRCPAAACPTARASAARRPLSGSCAGRPVRSSPECPSAVRRSTSAAVACQPYTRARRGVEGAQDVPLGAQSSKAISPVDAAAGRTAADARRPDRACETDGAAAPPRAPPDKLAESPRRGARRSTPRCVPCFAQAAYQRARIDPLQARHAPACRNSSRRRRAPSGEGAPPARARSAPRPRGGSIRRRVRHPVVADLRVGDHHHLPAIRRVGPDLLVAGDARVEHDFAAPSALGARTACAEGRPCRPPGPARRRMGPRGRPGQRTDPLIRHAQTSI